MHYDLHVICNFDARRNRSVYDRTIEKLPPQFPNRRDAKAW